MHQVAKFKATETTFLRALVTEVYLLAICVRSWPTLLISVSLRRRICEQTNAHTRLIVSAKPDV
jgi:hypothetical protein